MIYYYARVSSKEQNLDRQLENAKKFTIDKLFTEKASGKDFDRPVYQEMKAQLKPGDTVIFQTLDRLGRNKELTKKELEWYKANGILVRIEDIPTTMMQTDEGSQWVIEMINNVIIEVVATMAEQERKRLLERQRQGIDAMQIVNGKKVSKRSGKPYGRQPLSNDILERIKEGATYEQLGISRAVWYKYRKKLSTISQ